MSSESDGVDVREARVPAPHVDAERHHHHTHGASSRHPGDHHLLTVEDLTVSFDRYGAADGALRSPRGGGRVTTEVLHALTLSVHEGEIVAVVGASGSGKTVLADALLGLYEPNATVSGRIWFDGEPLDASSLAALRGRGICLVPQSVSHLDPLMRVGAQVRGASQGRTRAERAADRARREARQRELFEAYGLAPEVARLYPHELSGGMARRVLLMCALMEEPRVLIADEPTPGLDAELAVRAVDDLRAFANTGSGVILITHDLELAVRVADRIAVFKDGSVVEETAASNFAEPELLEHPFSRALSRELHALRADAALGIDEPGPARGGVLLRAAGLSFAYGSQSPLFAGLDLEVRAGERVALLGPSGVGKTTLCRLLAGILEPSEGSVRVGACEPCGSCGPAVVSRGSCRNRGSVESSGAHRTRPRPVQLIPQHPERAFDPRMRMRDSLGEAGDVDGGLARGLCDRFGVRDEWLDRLPHELSGGELMRCCLVRALMAQPDVLICDESTAMLDLVTQAELWRVIIELQARAGFGLVFVSHSGALVRRIATRRVVIE